MADPVITEVAGLQLANNTFSASPPGSLLVADNVVISQKGVAQPRNGQERASTLPAATSLPFALTEFQQRMIAQYGTSKTDTSQALGYVNAGAITPYSGTYNPVGDNGSATDYARMHFTLASLFLHFCAATGPRTLETYNGTPRRSGLTRVPDFAVTVAVPSGTQLGPIPYDSSVAFRYTHKRITSTGQVLTSPPSARVVVTNRYLVLAGSMSRAGTTVTATITPGQLIYAPFAISGVVTVSPGETDFPAGAKTLTGASSVAGGGIQLTWTEAGAATSSTVDQEIMPATSGALKGRALIRLPADAIAGDIIQLWKSVATSGSEIEPPADVYLCNEHLITSGEVAAGSITIDDYTPESALQVPLYTNPSDGDGQGELGEKFPPPIYLDAANFDSRVFYLGITGQRYLDLQMLGVGGPDGIQDGDTLTIFDGVATTTVFTFRTAPSVTGDVRLITSGTPGYNIAWTTFYLTFAAASASIGLVALGVGVFGSTSPNGYPGAFRIERTDYLSSVFQVKASRPASWSPALQAATYTNSFGSSKPNGLVFSKAAEPEAVPVINTVGDGVGVSNYYGRRCFGLRNSLIVLKEGDGIWSLTGSGGNYNLSQISTANIIAPDCACIFADCVWAYTDQGILRISDSGGVQTVSRPIETELGRLATLYPTQTYAWSFAVAYETERRVMFYVPVDVSPSNSSLPLLEAWCYSAATNAWTRFNHEAISGIVSTAHLLWTGVYDEVFLSGRLTSERKTDSYLDIADGAWANVLATTADPLVISLTTAGAIQEGTGISQDIGGTTYRTKVAEVLGGGLYEVSEVVPWASGACTIYDPYTVKAKFLPKGDPGARKSLSRLFTLYKPLQFSNYFGRTVLETDQMQSELEIDAPALGYGLTPYGGTPYGNPSPMIVDSNPIAAKWANAGQFFPGFRLDEVWCQMKLQGVGMQIANADAPVGRGT